MFKKNKKLAEWQDKLQRAKSEYQTELDKMDRRTAYYEGTSDILKKTALLRRAKRLMCATLCTSFWRVKWIPRYRCRA